ncbi:MAG: radical SAM protein [Clostridia bacterium]|nr:radical SAM protein [Clostridia bacterium]
MRHANIALFVAHRGCPHQCSFCNQHIISGTVKSVTAQDITDAITNAKNSGCNNAQLAFFGGSFTAIERDYMESLLKAAKPFIDNGDISGIRVSTRPDAINEEVLQVLKFYGVEAIELGAQSMDDEVLALNERGHTAQDVVNASRLIKLHGFELGLQMMTGLFGDTHDKCIRTAKELAKLRPDTIRIYPTVVLEKTKLAQLYKSGVYKPQSLDNAILLCSQLLRFFDNEHIRVIRLGLHSGGSVEQGFVAGVYHPAFRELCESAIYLEKAKQQLLEMPKGKIVIFVSTSEISKMIGQKKYNIKQLQKDGYECKVKQDKALKKYEIRAEKDG